MTTWFRLKILQVLLKKKIFLVYWTKQSLCDGMVDVPVLGTGVFDVSVRVRPKAINKKKNIFYSQHY